MYQLVWKDFGGWVCRWRDSKSTNQPYFTKSCQVIGVFYGAFSARYPLENERNFQEILDYVEKGAVIPLTGKTFPLEEYKEALTCLAERRAIGKIVVKVQ